MKILFVGGGSIGHIAPSIAVWRSVERMSPDAQCHFVCSDRAEESDFLKKEKVPFTELPFRHVRLSRPHDALISFMKARQIIRRWKPDVVFSKGGALSVPVALGAKMAGIPLVIHESDAVSGRATRLMTRWAKIVCHGFPGEEKREKRKEKSTGASVFTGNPVRPEVTQGSKEEGLRITRLTGKKPILFVSGGSQGALALNEAIKHNLSELLKLVQIIHLTGKGKAGAGKHPGYFSKEFAQAELPHFYAAADIALGRAGAGTISELAACGIPSFLVPLRGLAQDHQLANALAAEKSGGCILVHQETLDRDLVPALRSLIDDAGRLKKMQDAVRTLYVPDAADRIAALLLKGRSH